jgi:ParB-like chromosome segregation protein Spo0J
MNELITVHIKDITVTDRKRTVNPQRAQALAESIRELGLMSAIGVRKSTTNLFELVYGLHRLEAVKILGWEYIDAVLLQFPTEQDYELAEIDENLIRSELTELEQAVQLARRKALYLEKYPQTAHGGDRRSSRQRDSLKPKVPSFSEDAAAKLKVSSRTIQRKTALGEALRSLADVLRDTPIADNASDLKILAALPEAERQAIVTMLSSGEADTLKEARALLKKSETSAAIKRLRTSSETALERPQTSIRAKVGTWYALGRHRLFCGDTSTPDFWGKLPFCEFAFADPPYGVGADSWDQSFKWKHDYLIDIAKYVCVTPGTRSLFDFAKCTTMPYRWLLTCYIDNGMTRGDLGFGNHIPTALFAWPDTSIMFNSQDLKRVSIKQSETEHTDHRGRKPLEYMFWLIQLFAGSSNFVVDPFAGSGQTLWACHSLGKTCFTGEIDPDTCNNIFDRWLLLTGTEPIVLDGFSI